MRSLEQKRAAAALSAVAQWTGKSGLRAELENLPKLVAVNGLLTALLRLRKEGSDVLVPLEAWLVSPESPARGPSARSGSGEVFELGAASSTEARDPA